MTVLFLLLSLQFSFATEQNLAAPIDRFVQVDDGFYRGAKPPTLESIRFLKAKGFKTILDISSAGRAANQESHWARQVGIQRIHIPMSASQTPSDKMVEQIQELLNDKSLHPIFLHCLHGRDRTGLMVGIYRMKSQGWSARDAYDEMIYRGFREWLVALREYFWKAAKANADRDYDYLLAN